MTKIITFNDLPLKDLNICAVGNFDGVHTGHAALFELVRQKSVKTGMGCVVFTFIQSHKSPVHITGTNDKMLLLDSFGINDLKIYYADFELIRDKTPAQFVDLLYDSFGVRSCMCGYDFRFGSGRAGDASDLKRLMEQRGAEAVIVPPVETDGVTVSSTLIRQLIKEGRIEQANKLLGHNFSFLLPVGYGRRVGRTLGFPTINQAFPDYLVCPAFGVYAVEAEAFGVKHKGVANIGMRPSVDEKKGGPICETHLLDFEGDLYEREVRIILHSRIRPEKKFSSMEELKKQISADCNAARDYFNNPSKKEKG